MILAEKYHSLVATTTKSRHKGGKANQYLVVRKSQEFQEKFQRLGFVRIVLKHEKVGFVIRLSDAPMLGEIGDCLKSIGDVA
jgi:hypothetical protein